MTRAGWHLDEGAHAGPEHLDLAYAVGYDAKTGAELEEHVRTEHSTFSWLLEPLLEHAGFEVRDVSHRRGAYSTYVCSAR